MPGCLRFGREAFFSAQPLLVKQSLPLLLHNRSWISKSISAKPWGILRVGKIVLFFPRGGGSNSYEIISTFPQRVYADNSRSLQECGLIPNASLLLRRRDPSQQEGTGLPTA